MLHQSFDTYLATKFSIEEAIIIHRFQLEIGVNQRLKRNFFEGRTWYCNPIIEIYAHFDYMKPIQFHKAIDRLISREIILQRDHHENTERENRENTPQKITCFAFKDEDKYL